MRHLGNYKHTHKHTHGHVGNYKHTHKHTHGHGHVGSYKHIHAFALCLLTLVSDS